jgi:hypothetical protein
MSHRRSTNFPILITIALYERQAKKIGTVGVGETLLATTEHFLETLPRNIKRWSAFLVFPSCMRILIGICHSSSWKTLIQGGVSDIDAVRALSLMTRTLKAEGFRSQIFELEDQLDSALDTHDQQDAPPPMGHSAKPIIVRRARGSVGSHTYSRAPSQSSLKPDSSPGRQCAIPHHNFVECAGRVDGSGEPAGAAIPATHRG